MNNRNLYKAKFDDSYRWIKGQLIQQNDIYFIIPPEGKISLTAITACTFSGSPVRGDTICQSTGLRDKNDKLIWENDIIDFLGHKGIIKYECGSFGIAFKEIIDWKEIATNIMSITGCENTLYACENDNYISFWEIHWNFNDEDDCLNTIEVIGNKFDNVELLESEVEI